MSDAAEKLSAEERVEAEPSRVDVVVHVSVAYAPAQSPAEIARHIRAVVDECARVGVRVRVG